MLHKTWIRMLCLALLLLMLPLCALAESAPEYIPIGQGQTVFTLTVSAKDGRTFAYQVSTDEATVGDALLRLGLISGDEGPYGLYVKNVCCIHAEYETTGTYWAFYIGDEYAVTGVDTTAAENAGVYSLREE